MKIIGVTGSSGSGKSTVSKMICDELNVKIIDADKIAKKMQKPGNEYYKKIVELFGKDYLMPDKSLNREKIAKLIFEDGSKKQLLDELTKKYVVEEIKSEIDKMKDDFIVLDVPLLIESNLNNLCDIVIGVVANYDIKIDRICKRDNIKKENAILRLSSQKTNEFYEENVDYIVENNGGNYDKLLGRIREILQNL